MSKEIQQISEEQFKKIFDIFWWTNGHESYNCTYDLILRDIKKAGYIKKTKLLEAREYYQKIIETDGPEYEYDLFECFKRLYNKYEQAIEEKNQPLDK